MLRISLVREHLLHPCVVSDFRIVELLDELGLTNTALNINSFVKKVVLEFYTNLSKDISDVISDDAHLAYVKGTLISFSPP